ncbi:MAG: methylenetetrahydrofolate reductase C-terminal domain-containing protein [Lentisphaeria bacterium]|nr:methylenetetrahydrofolate reductase C-terminal domain-containing protein [Lentisphaeria bacterium]
MKEKPVSTPPSNAQLTMDFSGDNPFSRHLNGGEFSAMIECATPSTEQPFDSAVVMSETLARKIKDMPFISGMLVTDRQKGEDTHDPVDMAARLAAASGKPVVLTISGKGSDEKRVRDLLARASSAGIRNILAVTGDKSEDHPVGGHSFLRPGKHPKGYFDSIETILTARGAGYPFCLGAGVNPYKYNAADTYLQYYKMIRKIACGADFMVTHVGWDMKKLQELQWYLQMREIGVPVIARLALLSPDDIRRIDRNLFPGVCLSRPFAAALQRESDLSDTQSLAAQLQRLSLQIAGCKLLGFNGVQIAGVKDVQTLDMVLKRAKETLNRYQDYEDWATAWNDHHRAMEFSPLAQAYYVFKNPLSPKQWLYDPETCKLTDCPFPHASRRDHLQSAFMDFCLSDKMPEPVGKILANLIAPGHIPDRKQLEYCFNLCPHTCPKDLVYGACGGSRPDGVCEFGQEVCFFHRVLALAAEKHLLDRLEEPVTRD